MNRKTICEAMYASSNGAVVRRSKPVTMPLVLLACGAVPIVLNLLFGAAWSNDLRSAALFIGAVLLLWGSAALIARLRDREGRPCCARTNRPLRRIERYYPQSLRADIERAIAEGAVERLLALPDGGGAAVGVMIYRAADGSFAAMQAAEYVDFEYRPLTEVRIVEGAPSGGR